MKSFEITDSAALSVLRDFFHCLQETAAIAQLIFSCRVSFSTFLAFCSADDYLWGLKLVFQHVPSGFEVGSLRRYGL
jgi:hypothetical protein